MSLASSIAFRLTSAAAVLCLASPTPGAAPTIYNLGTLGGTQSTGYAINEFGQIAGTSTRADNVYFRAFRYTGTPGNGGVMEDLGTLGGTDSFGRAINNSGQVTGISYPAFSFNNRAFRYTGAPGNGGQMVSLGTLGGSQSEGYAINDAGQVAGYSDTTTTFGSSHAFRYDGAPGSGGVMRDLGTLGGTVSYGWAINDAGQVAGSSRITAGNPAQHAFRYDGTPGSGGVMRDLGTLGGTYSFGNAVNDAAQVAGESDITGNAASHAFRYDGTPGSGGVMRDLGTFGGTRSVGLAVNDAAQVAGWSFTTGNAAQRAFLYTGTPGAGGQMIDLNTWLDQSYPAEGAKWTLSEARGINNAGTITGIGQYNDGPGGLSDGTRAYLLQFPATTKVHLAWDTAAPILIEPKVNKAGKVIYPSTPGSMPAASASAAFRLDLEDRVKQIFAGSGINTIQFVSAPTPDATTVYFVNPIDSSLLGQAYTGVDHFNRRANDPVAVFLGQNPDAELYAETVGHELGHAFGLRHVYPGSAEIMDYNLQPGVGDLFNNVVYRVREKPTAEGTDTGDTHNPRYHLRRYVGGDSSAALDAAGVEPGSWDTGLWEKIVTTLGFGKLNRTLYEVDLMAGGDSDSMVSVAHFDQITLDDLSAMEFTLDQGLALALAAASAPGLQQDILLAMGDPFAAGTTELYPIEGTMTAELQWITGPTAFETLGSVSISGTLVPEPGTLSALVLGTALFVAPRRRRR